MKRNLYKWHTLIMKCMHDEDLLRHQRCLHTYKRPARCSIIYVSRFSVQLTLWNALSQNFPAIFAHNFTPYIHLHSPWRITCLLSLLPTVKYFRKRWPQLFGELLWIWLFIGYHNHMTRTTIMQRWFANVQSWSRLYRWQLRMCVKAHNDFGVNSFK